MSSLSKVAIDIVTQYKGANEVKKAQSSLSGLDSAIHKLGKTLAATFGTAAIAKFGKDSVQAFAADQAAASSLAKTLKNVGQGFSDTRVENFIKATETSTGVLDEKLRPAMETLVRATRDANKAQDLLSLSLDVAQGSGKDLATVSAALGKAYLGQTTALSKLGVGLTSAQLKGKSFADIQTQLNSLFGGQAADFAQTYAGKIQKIGTAWDNVKETVGKGLIDAFTSLSQSTSIDSFTKQMQDTATAVADIARGIGDVGAAIKNLPGLGVLGKLASFSFKNGILGYLMNRGKKDRLTAEDLAISAASQISGRGAGFTANQTMAKTIAEYNAAIAAQAKANAEKAKQLKLDTAIAMLKKSMAVFDQQRIQIAAALQNKKLTADEENRLKLMQAQADLQQAIDDKNTAALDPLMQKIKDLQDQIAAISKLSAGNPFAEMLAGATAAGIATVALLNSIESRLPKAMVGLSSEAAAVIGESRINANSVPSAPSLGQTNGGTGTNGTPPQKVEVTVTTSEDLKATIVGSLVNGTASGVPSTYNRNMDVAW